MVTFFLKFILWNFQIHPKAERLVFSLLAIYQYFVDLMSSAPLPPPTVFVLEVQLIDRFSLSLPDWDLIHIPSNLLILKCVIQQFSVHSQSCVIISLMKFGIFLLPLRGNSVPLSCSLSVPPFSLSPLTSRSCLSLSPLSPDLSLPPFSLSLSLSLSPQPWPLTPAFLSSLPSALGCLWAFCMNRIRWVASSGRRLWPSVLFSGSIRPFSLLNGALSYGCAVFYASIYQLMSIWVASTFWLLLITC